MTIDSTDLVEDPYTTDHPATPKVSAASAASALLLGIALLMIGNGLGGSVVGIRAELESFNTIATGAIMAAYFGGFLVGARMTIRLLAGVGHVRVFAALASMASTMALVQAIAVSPAVWAPTRFITGMCMAGLYVVAESWLNDIATVRTRGRLLAAYMVVSMGGLGIGQGLLVAASALDVTLFIVASVLISMAVVPISLSTTSAPPIMTPEPMSLRELVRIVPTGVVSMFFVGLAAGVLFGMGAVYATRSGLNSNQTALFLFAPIIGAVVFQFPLGILSDRVPRRGMLAIVASAAAVISLVLARLDISSLGGTIAMIALGGAIFPLYSLSIAYTNDWIPNSKMVAASSSLVMVNGAGAIIGPLATAALFAVADEAFFFLIAGSHGAMATYIGWRIMVKDALPMERQRPWVPLSFRATSAISVLARPVRRRPR
jgi:MFS family permease